MDKIETCVFNGKDGYRLGKNGKCYTYNQNKKSKLKAYNLAKNQQSLISVS
jgi:hypothetical protein